MAHSLQRLDDDPLREQIRGVNVYQHDSGQLPFGNIDASHFELLIADLFRHMQGTGVDWNWYDDVCRVNDGADNGVDVLLSLDQESRGIVQCKRYSSADVTMTLVRQELLALTLRGLIIDDLLPPEDHSTPFRYILAVSNNVAADVFSFFTKKNAVIKDLTNNQSKWETAARIVKSKYALLKNSSVFTGKTDAQLLAMVSDRLKAFKYALFRQESLSPLVRRCDYVMNTYFAREQVCTVDEIHRLFQEYMPEQPELLASNYLAYRSVYTRYFNATMLYGKRLHSVLIHQRGHEALKTLDEMLTTHLPRQTGSQPSVIVFCADAFTLSDYATLNNLISSYPFPVVLQAGFGCVKGSDLNGLRESAINFPDGDTTLYPADADYQGGWCWIKEENSAPEVWLLLETTDRGSGTGHGRLSLRLSFADINLWCTLSGDFYPDTLNKHLLCEKVLVGMKDDRSGRGNLLLVSSAGPIQQNTVCRQVNLFNMLRRQSELGVVLCHAAGNPEISEALRHATGFFPLSTGDDRLFLCPKAQDFFLLRSSHIASVILTLTFDKTRNSFSLIDSFLYQRHAGQLLSLSKGIHMELDRMLSPLIPATMYPMTSAGLTALRQGILTGTIPYPENLVQYALNGTGSENNTEPDSLHYHRIALLRILKALSYLSGDVNISWQSDTSMTAHLSWEQAGGQKDGILGWDAQGMNYIQVQSRLLEWMRDGSWHPDLFVFALFEGHMPAGQNRVPLDLTRNDIVQPDEIPDSTVMPRISRRAWVVGLMDLVQNSMTSTTTADRTSFLKQIQGLKNG